MFTRKQRKLATTVLAVIALITGGKIFLRYERIRVALEFGHLASLPDNAKKVRVETAGFMFSRTFWLTFESTDEEIDKWIKGSKHLTKNDWESLRPKSDVIFYWKDEKTGLMKKVKYEYVKVKGEPDWFNPEDLTEDELFNVSIPSEALYGTVWIDRKNKKVFIKTSYS